MSDADWLLETGVDTRKAISTLTDFKKTAEALLNGIGDEVVLNVDTKKMTADTSTAINNLKETLRTIPAVNLKFNLAGASRSINALGTAMANNGVVVNRFTAMLINLNTNIDKTMEKMAELAPIVQEAAEAVRSIAAYTRSASVNVEMATRTVDVYNRALETLGSTSNRASLGAQKFSSAVASTGRASVTAVSGHKQQEDAIQRLGKIFDNTVFKFVEYEVIMRAFNGVVHEFTNSINQASSVQFESTLQHLYSPTVKLNDALKDSIDIAKQWGADITDVQQVVGMWTKITQDETSAAYLANEAEKMHRASGMDTLELFRNSVAIMQQMGIKAGAIPHVYDQITEAALRLAEPLKNLNGKGGPEGMRDLTEGLSKFGALGRSMGLDTAGVLALVSNQIQTMAEHGKEAGNALSSLFGAMDAHGNSKINFENILGHDAFAGADGPERTIRILQAMSDKRKELAKAMADNDIIAKPQQIEVEKSLQASIGKVIELTKALEKVPKGRLDIVANAEMATFPAKMDRLKTSVQAFSLSIGAYLLPNMTKMVDMLSQQVLPTLGANAQAFIQLGAVGAKAAVALIGLQAVDRIRGYFGNLTTTIRTANVELANNERANRIAALAGFDSAKAMETQRAAAADLQKAEAELTAAITFQGEQAGLSGAKLDLFVTAQSRAAMQSGRFDKALAETNDTMRATQRVTAMNIFGGIASSALKTLGPLAAMMAALSAVEAISNGFNNQKVAEAQFEDTVDWRKHQRTSAPVPSKMEQMAGLGGIGSLSSAQSMLYGITHWGDKVTEGVGAARGRPPNEMMTLLAKYSHNKSDVGEMASAALKIANNPNASDSDIAQGKLYASEVYSKANAKNFGVGNIQAELERRIREAEAQAGLNRGNGESEEHVFGTKKGPNLTASPEALAMTQTQTDQKNATAAVSSARDRAAAEAKLAQEILQRVKAEGYSQKSVNEYKGHLDKERGYIQDEIRARQEEARNMARDVENNKKLVAGEKPGSKKARLAGNTLTMSEKYLTQTRGAITLLQAQLKDLDTTSKEAGRTFQLAFDLHAAGLDKFDDKLKDIKNHVQTATNYADKSKAISGGMNQLAGEKSFLEKEAGRYAHDQQNLDRINKMIELIDNSTNDLKKDWSDMEDKAATVAQTMQTLTQSIYGQNTSDIADALGIDKSSLDSVNLLVESYKKLNTEINELQTAHDNPNANHTAEFEAQYQSNLQELKTQEDLIPILARQKKIKEDIKKTEDSKGFKTVESSIQKSGDSLIDKMFKHQSGGVGDLFGGVMKDAWATVSKNITDKMFGLNKEDQKEKEVQSLYEYHVNGLKQFALGFKATVDSLLASALNQQPGTPGANMNTMFTTAAPQKDQLNTANPSAGIAGQDYDPTKLITNPVVLALTNGNPTQARNILDSTKNIETALTTPVSSGSSSSSVTAGSVLATLGAAAGGGGGASPTGSVNPGAPRSAGGTNDVSSGLGDLTTLLNSGNSKGATTGGLLSGLQGDMGMLKNIKWGSAGAGFSMANLGLGMASGSLFGSLMGGGSHSTWGDIGGAVGSFFGPVGAIAGGALGSLFGHADNPAAMPDKYDTNFASEEANLNGKFYTSEASGTQYMSSGVASATGGQGQIASIEELLAKYPNPQDAPAWLQPYYAQALSTFGSSATGAGTISYAKDIANEHIVGATGASTTDQNYQGIANLANTIEDLQAQHTNTAQAPILSINAFGSNGAYGNSIYNTPGLTSDQFNAIQGNAFSGTNLNNYYATPGVGTSTPSGTRNLESSLAGSLGSGNLNITSNLMVDGNVLATVVNAVNAATASRTATS